MALKSTADPVLLKNYFLINNLHCLIKHSRVGLYTSVCTLALIKWSKVLPTSQGVNTE